MSRLNGLAMVRDGTEQVKETLGERREPRRNGRIGVGNVRLPLRSMTSEQQLVQSFARKGCELDALRGLTGGVTATQLRTATLTDHAFDAVVAGLADPSPRVRWWCIQVLDHVPDRRAARAIAEMLDDPVPRVRRNAVHALGCVACKPGWREALPVDVREKLERLATDDPNEKVRREAALTLS
jgi:hypothetical protein